MCMAIAAYHMDLWEWGFVLFCFVYVCVCVCVKWNGDDQGDYWETNNRRLILGYIYFLVLYDMSIPC